MATSSQHVGTVPEEFYGNSAEGTLNDPLFVWPDGA